MRASPSATAKARAKRQRPGAPSVRTPQRQLEKGGPARTLGQERLCGPSRAGNTPIGAAVSSLSPAWGTSCWRHHMIHHRPPAPAGQPAPTLLSTCGLPGSTCDPAGRAPADPSRSGSMEPRPGAPTALSPCAPGGLLCPQDKPLGEACGGPPPQPPAPDCTGHRRQLADVSAGIFPPSMSPLPSPSPKWLQLSGPQIGTAGTVLAGCPPPSRVCLRERKPAHLWNPSLSPRSASPTCPPGARGQPPRSSLPFPCPSPITMQAVFPAPPARRSRLSRAPSAFLRLSLLLLPGLQSLSPCPGQDRTRPGCEPQAHLLQLNPRKVPTG